MKVSLLCSHHNQDVVSPGLCLSDCPTILGKVVRLVCSPRGNPAEITHAFQTISFLFHFRVNLCS